MSPDNNTTSTNAGLSDEGLFKLARGFMRGVMGVSVGLIGGLSFAGGIILVTAAATPFVASLGLAAAAVAGQRIYNGVKLMGAVDKILDAALTEFPKEADIPFSEQIKPPEKLAEEIFPDAPRWLKHPVTQGAMSLVVCAAGIALWPVGGILTSAAAAVMTVTGGISVAGAALSLVCLGIPPFFDKPAAAQEQTPAAPATELAPSPASKLGGLEAGKAFTVAANENLTAPKSEAPAAKSAAPQPPKAA